jgi:hypothetical protein
VHRFLVGAAIVAQQMTSHCGNAAVVASPQNTIPVVVDAGPARNALNIGYVTISLCMPGQTANCQTIDSVMVDTGSSGLRLLSSVVSLPLAQQHTSSGAGVVECFPFQDGFTWGPVVTADLQLGSKRAAGGAIQLIGGPGLPPPPDSCTNSGLTSEDTIDVLGANGVLGLGFFRQDCGPACAFTGDSNPGLYFGCTASGCQVAMEPIAQQLQNPVWQFSSDNNGVVLSFPSVPLTGQSSAAGLLVFGIGTQANNALGGASVFQLDGGGSLSTAFNGTTVTGFVDSGSNGLYFLDASTAQIASCPDTADFYCPLDTLHLSAVNSGTNGRSGTIAFTVGNADTLFNLPVALLPQIAGPFPGYFDWGLPFFYGRTVFTAIEGQNTPGGVGPYVAY